MSIITLQKFILNLKRKVHKTTKISLGCLKTNSSHTDEKAQSIKCEICQRCNREFSNPSDLKYHMKTHTGGKLFKCNKCKQTYTRKNLFHKHIMSHTNDGHEKLVICEVCNKKFTRKRNLVQHIETVHATIKTEAPFSCKVCNDKFQRKSHLTNHKKTHSLRKYVCEICKRSFIHEGSYKIHMDTHSHSLIGTKPVIFHICKMCDYEFANNTTLVNHMRLHTGEKPFACETCEKKFAFKVALVRHYCINGDQPYMKKLTTKEEPKVCNICHAQFKSEITLANHMRMHTGHKPFRCKMCEKQFAFKVALVTHVCINGEKPYMIKTKTKVEKTIEPINNIATVKVERIESKIEIEVSDRIEIKKEKDELESEDIGMAWIEAVKTEIKEEY